MMKTKLKVFLDDLREPIDIYPNVKDGEYVTIRSFNDFKSFVENYGIPSFISFDNDLGDTMEEGKDVVKWMVFEKMLDISDMDFKIHSANSSGVREYMEGTLNNWKKELNK